MRLRDGHWEAAGAWGEGRQLRRMPYALATPPDGPGTVELRFRPPGLIAGALVSALALLACDGLLVGDRSPTRRRPG